LKRKNKYPLTGLLVRSSGRAAFRAGAFGEDCSGSKLMGRRGMDDSSSCVLLPDGSGMGGPPSWTELSLEEESRAARRDPLEEPAPGVCALSVTLPSTLKVN